MAKKRNSDVTVSTSTNSPKKEAKDHRMEFLDKNTIKERVRFSGVRIYVSDYVHVNTSSLNMCSYCENRGNITSGSWRNAR